MDKREFSLKINSKGARKKFQVLEGGGRRISWYALEEEKRTFREEKNGYIFQSLWDFTTRRACMTSLEMFNGNIRCNFYVMLSDIYFSL